MKLSGFNKQSTTESKNIGGTMKEEDLALARILVQESENESPGGSPSPLRRTPVQIKKVFR